MPTKCCWVQGDPRQADQRTQSCHFPIVIHQSLDPAARAQSSLSLHALEHSTGSERVDASGLRAVEVTICMITRDFSVISMTSQASLSLSLSLSTTTHKVTHTQYRKRFRTSYNTASGMVSQVSEGTEKIFWVWPIVCDIVCHQARTLLPQIYRPKPRGRLVSEVHVLWQA